MTTCPSCRREQVQSSAFCAYCGAVLDRPATAPVAPADIPVAPGVASPAAVAASPQIPLKHDVGDVGVYIVRRLLALVVDIVVVGALIAVAGRAWISRAGGAGITASEFFELLLIVAGGLFAYRWLLEGVAGTTLGKLLFGLAVSRDSGSAGLGRSFVRNLLLPVDLALVGFLVAALTPQRRRLGDLLAGTVVKNSRMGVLAPAIGVLVLGAAAYGVNMYAGGLSTARNLAHDAAQLAPTLINGASPTPAATPSPSPSPLPSASLPPT
jgi:uncharacterized RDD family membrane protein YckC